MFSSRLSLRHLVVVVALLIAIGVSTSSLRVGSAADNVTVKLVSNNYVTEQGETRIDLSLESAQDVINLISTAPDNAVLAVVIPGDAFDAIEVQNIEFAASANFVAVTGTIPELLGNTNVSLLFALAWDDPDSDPDWVIAAGLDSFSLSSINSAWTLPGSLDPTITDGYIALASADFTIPDLGPIGDFFPDGFSTKDGVNVEGGATIMATVVLASIIGDKATETIFGDAAHTETLRAHFDGTTPGLFNLPDDDPTPPDFSPTPTEISFEIKRNFDESPVGFAGYVTAIGDWAFKLEAVTDASSFDVSGSGRLKIADSVVKPNGIELDFALAVAYDGTTTTVTIETEIQPLTDIFGTGVTINQGKFTATMVSGPASTADFHISGSISIGAATAAASLDISVAAGSLQSAELALSLDSVNLGEIVQWASTQLGTGAVPTMVLDDITLQSASLTVKFEFGDDGISIDFEATATVEFGGGPTVTATLTFSVASGSLQNIEFVLEIGNVNIGEVATWVATQLNVPATDIPAILNDITLQSASLRITLDFADGVSIEIEAKATIAFGDDITASASLLITISGGSLQSVDFIIEIENVNIGVVTQWALDQLGISATVPSELNALDLDSARLRIGLNLGDQTSIEFVATAQVSYSGFGPTLTGSVLLYIQAGTDTHLTIAVALDSDLTLNTIVPAIGDNDFGNMALPNFAFGLSTGGISWDSNDMAPEVFGFFSFLYNCDSPADPCSGVHPRNDIPAAPFIIAAIDIPQPLKDPLSELWINVDDPVVIKGAVPGIFSGGGEPELSLQILLPRITPPEPINHVVDSGELGIGFSVGTGGLTVSLEGSLTVWLPTVLEPELGNQDDFQRTTFLVAMDLGLDLGGISITLTGAMMPGPGEDAAWATPFGQDWLTIQSLAMQFSIGVATSGAIEVSIGLGGGVELVLGGVQKDFQASFEIGALIQSIPGPPGISIIPKPKGFRLASVSGVELADVVQFYSLIAGDLPVLLDLDDEFPDLAIPAGWEDFNVGIKDIELSFAIEDNARLCLFTGLRIKGDLYIAGTPNYIPETAGEPCIFGSASNTPREVTPGGSCSLGNNAGNGCFAGVDISLSTSGLFASANMAEIEIGPVKIEDTLFEISLRTGLGQQYLKLAGGVVVEGVAKGNVELFIEPTGFEFLADLDLLAALFRARIQGHAGLSLTDPSFSIRGEMQTSFGAQSVQVFQPVVQPIGAAMVALNTFVQAMADPNADLNSVVSAVLNIPRELRALGYTGPVIDAMEAIAAEIRKVQDAVKDLGATTSATTALDRLLGGGTIGFAGEPGTWKRICVGIYVPSTIFTSEDCIGSWERVCFAAYPLVPGIPIGSKCWVIPPFSLTIPSLCQVLQLDINPCNLQGIKVYILNQLNAALNTITGVTINDFATAMNQAVNTFQANPIVFDLRCAAFDFSLGAGIDAPPSNHFLFSLHFIILGHNVYFSEIGWNFNQSVLTNLDNLRQQLLGALFGGAQDGAFTCDLGTQIGVTQPTTQPPSNLQITNINPAPVSEGQTLNITGTFDRGTAVAGDIVEVSITWPDNFLDTFTIDSLATSFTRSRLIVDDPPTGQPSSVQPITVVVENKRTGSTDKQATVTVNNVAPTIVSIALTKNGQAVTEIDEGDTVTLSGTFTDPGALDSHYVIVDWDDGTESEVFIAAGAPKSFQFSHTYVDGLYDQDGKPVVRNIEVKVVDKDTGQATSIVPLTVRNVAPELIEGSVEFHELIVEYAVVLDDDGNPVLDEDGNELLELDVIERIGPVTEINEGAVIEVSGRFTDPGLVDYHTVEIDWGDVNMNSDVSLIGIPVPPGLEQPGEREFRLVYVYVDDNPTKGQPWGDMIVEFKIVDKDGDESETVTKDIRVNNVDPVVQLSLEREVINENETAVLTIDIIDHGILDTFEIELDWGDGSPVEIFNAASIADALADATADEDGEVLYIDGRPARRIFRTHQYLDDNPTVTPEDDYTIKVHVTDDDTGEGDNEIVITVVNTDPRVFSISHPEGAPAEVQYSDLLSDLTYSPDAGELIVIFDDVAADELWATTSYQFFNIFDALRVPDGEKQADGSIRADGLPNGLAMVPVAGREDGEVDAGSEHCRPMTDDELAEAELPGPRIACTWTIDGRAMTAPGHYIITVRVDDDDSGHNTADIHLIVHPEDAEATYIGPTIASAPALNDATDGFIELELRTILRDITDFGSATGHPLWDPYEGDINNAIITYVDRDNDDAELCTTTHAGYVFDGNEQVGVAHCPAILTLTEGEDQRTYNIGIIVGGWYTNERSERDDIQVTIYRPNGDFVTGGGHLATAAGAGTLAPGNRTDVNFNPSWGMPGYHSLVGQTRLRFSSGGRNFEIDAISYDALGIQAGDGTYDGIAQLEARATLVDRTQPGRTITIRPNVRLQVRVTDMGDWATVGFALWDDTGRLLASSGWDEDHVPEVAHSGGNSEVHIFGR